MAFLSIMARFGMDSTGFKAGIKQAESAAKGLSRDLNSNLKGAIAGAFGTAAIVAAGKATLDYAGHINDLSDRLGISTDALQEFDFAARLTGTNLETFTGFLEKLAVARDAAIDGNEEMTASFAKLGVSLADLRTKRLDELTRQIGRAVQGGDAQALIPALKGVGGKGAGALIPTFKAGLDEAAQQARESGAIISPEDIAALDEAGDKFSALVSILRANLAPAISFVIDSVAALTNGFKRAGAFWGGLFGGGMEGARQALADADAEAARQQTAQQQGVRERRDAQAARPVVDRAGLLEKLREANAEKEEKLLSVAERRAKVEERIANLRHEVMVAEAIAAAQGTEEAQIELEKLRGKLFDAQAQIKEEAPQAIDTRPTDPAVNALERIGFSFGKTDAKPEVRHLESISRGIGNANAKLDRIANSSSITAEALA